MMRKGTNKLLPLYHFLNSLNSWHGKSLGNVRAARVEKRGMLHQRSGTGVESSGVESGWC
jgi:hypothetical protein